MQLLGKYCCRKNMSGHHPHGECHLHPIWLDTYGLDTWTDLIISGHVSFIEYYKHCCG